MDYLYERKNIIIEKLIPSDLKHALNNEERLGDLPEWEMRYFQANDFFKLGLLYLTVNDDKNARETFSKALEYAVRFFDLDFDRMLHPPQLTLDYPHYEVELVIYCIFFANKVEECRKYFENILKIPFNPPAENYQWNYYRSRGYSKLSLGNNDLTTEVKYMKLAEKRLPSKFRFALGYANVFKGFMDEDKELIITGLNAILNKYHRGYKKNDEVPISRDGYIIMQLAELNGITLLKKDIPEEFLIHVRSAL